MSLEFVEDIHEYRLDGRVLPSVTQILRETGIVDFGAVPATTLAAALDRGTTVHKALHFAAEGDLDVDTFCSDFPDYAGYLRSGLSLLNDKRFRTVLCERRVASFRHRYAGTVDWLGYVDGDAAILDWATGDPHDAGKDLQTAAYQAAIIEYAAVDEQVNGFVWPNVRAGRQILRYSARLQKDGSLPLITPYRDPRNFTDFLTLIAARRIVEARKGTAAAWAA